MAANKKQAATRTRTLKKSEVEDLVEACRVVLKEIDEQTESIRAACAEKGVSEEFQSSALMGIKNRRAHYYDLEKMLSSSTGVRVTWERETD